ncbi:hypothetical protein QAD02_013959 [Eretmocerus hayati]|uniref:Uncharacterized protein n=1 Tax=Eretmocerus hayati TaxID=131215 RepID=A0ACC2P453_9HYME|nr:hypothetical protein QAD02_013959 [Eretmocerus hayati]
MSAFILIPTMMSEMSQTACPIVMTTIAETTPKKIFPSQAALARVRRDLFGPVDHSAARALAESELNRQSLLDSEQWGFDFKLEVPRSNVNSRYEWQLLSAQEMVPKPYALQSMPYLRQHSLITKVCCQSSWSNRAVNTTDTSNEQGRPLSSISSLVISEPIQFMDGELLYCGKLNTSNATAGMTPPSTGSSSHVKAKHTLRHIIPLRNHQPSITGKLSI